MVICNHSVHGKLPEHQRGQSAWYVKFYKTSCIAVYKKLAICRSNFLLRFQLKTFCFRISCLRGSGQCIGVENFVDRRSLFPSGKICQHTELQNRVTENLLTNRPLQFHSEKVTMCCGFATSFPNHRIIFFRRV